MRNKSLIGLCAFALIFEFCGCAAFTEKIIEKPKVKLDHVEVADVGATGATVLFSVLVANPNNFALKVDSIKYDVEIGGNKLGQGRLEKGAKVEAKSESVIQIPVPVKYTEVFTSVMSFIGRGTSSYRIRGDANLGPLSIPFDKSGELKLEPPK
jgi:LEA14-like dessication related protein